MGPQDAPPDLAVVDLRLPDGSGLDLLARLSDDTQVDYTGVIQRRSR